MAVFDLNQPANSLSEEDDVAASNSHVVSVSSSINTGWIVYDSLDECIEMYRKYASEAGFGVRLSCQKRLKCGYVKQKYIVCNREGCPKDVWLNTLDPKKNYRQVRSLNFRVCGCKARVLLDMVPHTTKYTLTTFDVKHNHELDRVEYKHLSKAERKLTYNEQFDSQMLITKMEERQEFTKDFSFDYFVKDAELCSLFCANEVAKCNYKEFDDIKETAKAYGWLLRAFRKAFVRPSNIVVTDQDGAMRLAVAAEFPESKHRLCMWHIMQKIPTKCFKV
ncbi:FAR1-related sequence 5-like protein [Tanacetum coccineum]